MCHEDMATVEGLGKYIVAGKADESSLYLRVIDGSMPPSAPLGESERVFIRRYIESLAAPAVEQ
jgi:hypothetical protein